MKLSEALEVACIVNDQCKYLALSVTRYVCVQVLKSKDGIRIETDFQNPCCGRPFAFITFEPQGSNLCLGTIGNIII